MALLCSQGCPVFSHGGPERWVMASVDLRAFSLHPVLHYLQRFQVPLFKEWGSHRTVSISGRVGRGWASSTLALDNTHPSCSTSLLFLFHHSHLQDIENPIYNGNRNPNVDSDFQVPLDQFLKPGYTHESPGDPGKTQLWHSRSVVMAAFVTSSQVALVWELTLELQGVRSCSF